MTGPAAKGSGEAKVRARKSARTKRRRREKAVADAAVESPTFARLLAYGFAYLGLLRLFAWLVTGR